MSPTATSSDMTVAGLGSRVKAKYPGQYDDLPDVEVGNRVKAKFPGQYDDFADATPGMERLGGTPPGPAKPPLPTALSPERQGMTRMTNIRGEAKDFPEDPTGLTNGVLTGPQRILNGATQAAVGNKLAGAADIGVGTLETAAPIAMAAGGVRGRQPIDPQAVNTAGKVAWGATKGAASGARDINVTKPVDAVLKPFTGAVKGGMEAYRQAHPPPPPPPEFSSTTNSLPAMRLPRPKPPAAPEVEPESTFSSTITKLPPMRRPRPPRPQIEPGEVPTPSSNGTGGPPPSAPGAPGASGPVPNAELRDPYRTTSTRPSTMGEFTDLNRALHAAAAAKGIGHDELSDVMALKFPGIKSMREMTTDQYRIAFKDFSGVDYEPGMGQLATPKAKPFFNSPPPAPGAPGASAPPEGLPRL